VSLGVVWGVPSGLAGPPGPAEQARYAELDARPLKDFTNVELAEYLELRARDSETGGKPPHAADEVGRFALKSLRTPFRLNAVRFDLSEADCVVLVERCVAMALARDWQSYYKVSERLRHRDGVVAYRNRNFLTLGDWLPSNCAWLFRDVTAELGPAGRRPAKPFTHVVRPKLFKDTTTEDGKLRTTFLGTDWKSGEKEVRSDVYIPRDAVAQISGDLRTGDVVLVIYGVGKNAGCDHMGVISVEPSGAVMMVHCAPPAVRQEPLLEFVARYDRVSGFKFLRLRDDARQAVERAALHVDGQPAIRTPAEEDARIQALRERRGGPTPAPPIREAP